LDRSGNIRAPAFRIYDGVVDAYDGQPRCADNELALRLRSAGVDRWVRDRPRASDHAPTWIELDMGAKKEGAKRQRSTVKRSNTPSKITLGRHSR
jgi:hypothetical protein